MTISWKKLLKYLGSMSFAFIILCLLALVSIIGTVIAQNRSTDFYRATYGDAWQSVLQSLDIYDMYHSWWYLSLLGFLLLSMCLAIWRHSPRSWRSFQKIHKLPRIPNRYHARLTVTQDTSKCEQESSVAQALTKAGFKDWMEQSNDCNETLAFGRKGRIGKLGFIGVHLGLITILIGGLVSTQLGYRAAINIPEGESVQQAHISSGDDHETIDLPFEIRNDKFVIDYYETGRPSGFQTDLTIIQGGETIAQKRISVNDPLTIDDITLYQASFGDAGSPVNFTFTNLRLADFPQQQIDSNINKIHANEDGNRVTVKALREHTVINLPETPNQRKSRDVGPSLDIEMQTPAIGTTTFRSYLHFPHIIAFKKLGTHDHMLTVELGISTKDNKMIEILAAYMRHLFAEGGQQEFSDEQKQTAFSKTLTELKLTPSNKKDVESAIAKTADALILHDIPALFSFNGYTSSLYTGLQVARDPGSSVVWLGCLFLMAGLCVIYIAEYRVWVNIKVLNTRKKQYEITLRSERPCGIGVSQIVNQLQQSLKETEYTFDEVTVCQSLT